MTRKLLIKIIASLYMAQGIWDVGVFFFPIFTLQKPLSLNLLTILAGALNIWAGIYLFQLSEFGRKYVIFLLSLRIVYNAFLMGFFIVGTLHQSDLGTSFNFLGKSIFESKSIYPFLFALFVSLLIALGAVIFLSKKQTKILFISEAKKVESSKPINELASKQ